MAFDMLRFLLDHIHAFVLTYSHILLLALLNKLEVLIKVVPVIVLRRLSGSRLHIILSRDLKLFLRLARRNIAVKLVKASLVDRKTIRVNLASNQINPPLIALRQDVVSDIASVLVRIAGDRNNIVTACDFVVLEPVVESSGHAGTVILNVFDCVHIRCDRVVDVDHHDLPVSLAAVVGSNATEDLGLSDLAEVAGILADVEEVNGIVVAWLVDEGVFEVRVFPCLRDLGLLVACSRVTLAGCTYRAVDERVGSVRPYGLYKARSALAVVVEDRGQRLLALDFDLAVSPTRDLDDRVDDLGVVLIRVQRNLA